MLDHLNGKKLLDGGATDSIPVDAFMELGYEKNVLILTRDMEYRKSPELSFLPMIVYGKYPVFAKALLNRHTAYNKTIERILELEKQGKVFVIRPEEPLNIGRMEKDPANVQRVYDIGYADAVKQLDELKAWLSA